MVIFRKLFLGRFPKETLGVRLAECPFPTMVLLKFLLNTAKVINLRRQNQQNTHFYKELPVVNSYHDTPHSFETKINLTIPKTNTSPLKNGAFCQKDRLPTELLDQGHRHPQDTATHGEPELRISAKNKETGKPKPGPRFPKTTDMFYGDIKLMDLLPLWIVGQCRWTWIDLCEYININTYKS